MLLFPTSELPILFNRFDLILCSPSYTILKLQFKANTMKNNFFGILLCLLLLLLPLIVFSQPPGLPGDPSQAPVDGGLGILAAAGGAYAFKKIRDRSR